MTGDDPVEVCGATASVNITGGSMCDWDDDVRYPCTWYAYQFDFQNADPEQLITCDVVRSIATRFGPGTEQVTGAYTASYTESLVAAAGHIFHPGFNTCAPVDTTTQVRESHICGYAGSELYRVVFSLIFEPET